MYFSLFFIFSYIIFFILDFLYLIFLYLNLVETKMILEFFGYERNWCSLHFKSCLPKIIWLYLIKITLVTTWTTKTSSQPIIWLFYFISDHDMSNFVVHGILLCLVACFGVLSNIISIYIYSRPKMKTPINCILIGNYVLTNLAN